MEKHWECNSCDFSWSGDEQEEKCPNCHGTKITEMEPWNGEESESD